MPQVGAGVSSAYPALTFGVGWPLVLGKTGILNIDPSFGCEQESVPGSTRRQDTIHHVHSHRGISYDFLRIAHTHNIAWLVLWQDLQHGGDHLPGFLPRLANTQP